MKAEIKRHLSNKDLGELLTFSYNSLSCESEESLKTQILALSALIPFGTCLCAHGHIPSVLKNPKPQLDLLNISYPPDYLAWYFETSQHLADPVLAKFLKTNTPVNWLQTKSEDGVVYPEVVHAVDYGMDDGWTHGLVDTKSMTATAFYLGGGVADNSDRTRAIIDYIIPFFTKAYIRILKTPKPMDRRLTPKETEVLNWIKEGKSSWEISSILNCSKRVVEFHVANITKKLNAVNRTQAVVTALHQGFIGF